MQKENLFKSKKLFTLEEAVELREKTEKPFVLTNGCFDLLHPGHVFCLEQAAVYGDLWIALNSDRSVRELKGENRPILNEKQRAFMLSSLECVKGVFIFDGKRLHKEIEQLRPDVYVKSTSYRIDIIDPGELKALIKSHSQIRIVEHLDDISTSHIINKIMNFI